MKKIILFLSVVLTSLLILNFITIDYSPKYYKVIRVIDGDTFEINYHNKKEKVRLIGVDTPESVKANSPVEHYGKESSRYTKNLIEEKYIYLEFDVQKRDKYNRLLAYVYLSDGRMLNKILLQEGYAQIMTVPPNIKYIKTFLDIQNEARKKQTGLWKK